MPKFDTGPQWKSYKFEFKDLKQGGWGSEHPLTLNKIQSLFFRVQAPNQFPDQPGILFDTMIEPMKNFEFQGALWYQGESNLGRREEYGPLLKSIATGWRQALNNPQLAFLVVQLPDFGSPGNNDNYGSWAPFRAVQTEILDLPYGGLAVTLGLGEGLRWHPRNKKPVGQRLAHEALRIAYSDPNARGYGPRLKNAHQHKGKITLAFETGGRKLAIIGKQLRGFEAQINGKWKPVLIKLLENQLVITSSKMEALRYAWRDNPIATLADDQGLPAVGFELNLNHN